jgi:nucleotide-binding universal stress UspA family protein
MSERIVCMVRGGASGRKLQEHGIRLAKECEGHLIFLHIIDIESLGLKNPKLLEAAREEMTWLARITLGLAYRRARSADVDVERVVRYGKLYDSVLDYLKEHPADRMLMGSPYPDVEDYEQRLQKIQQFARLLEDQTGVVVDIVK